MIDISTLTKDELKTLSNEIRQREFDITESSFEEFYKSKDFEYLCEIDAKRMQEQNVVITVEVPVLVSVGGDKDRTRIDIIARDKEAMIANSNMIDILAQKPEVKQMRTAALKAERLFDQKMHEFVDKYNLDRSVAWMKIINRISRVAQKTTW